MAKILENPLSVNRSNPPPELTITNAISNGSGVHSPPQGQPLQTYTAAELMTMTIAQPTWVIPNILTAGLSILAGSPKLGKSWMALAWALAVTSGGSVFNIAVEQGDVLYAALEDTQARMQDRINMLLMPGESAPQGLHIIHKLPRMHEGLISALKQWLTEHPQAKLIIIDTLIRIRSPQRQGADVYAADSAFAGELQQLAQDYQIALMLVHHLRKAHKGEAEDKLEMVSGSTGLTGSADSILVLERARGLADATLFVTGRDVGEQTLALAFDNGKWDAMLPLSDERREVLLLLPTTLPGMTPKAIASKLGKNESTVKTLLGKLSDEGYVKSVAGEYIRVRGLNPLPWG